MDNFRKKMKSKIYLSVFFFSLLFGFSAQAQLGKMLKNKVKNASKQSLKKKQQQLQAQLLQEHRAIKVKCRVAFPGVLTPKKQTQQLQA